MVSRNQLVPISQSESLLKADGDAAGIPWLIGPEPGKFEQLRRAKERTVRMVINLGKL